MAYDYNVVFEGVGGDKSNVKGVRTWTSFKSKEDFQEWLKETGHRDTVIAEGVAQDRAIELTRETSDVARLRYVWHEATKEGHLNLPIGIMHLRNLSFDRGRRR